MKLLGLVSMHLLQEISRILSQQKKQRITPPNIQTQGIINIPPVIKDTTFTIKIPKIIPKKNHLTV